MYKPCKYIALTALIFCLAGGKPMTALAVHHGSDYGPGVVGQTSESSSQLPETIQAETPDTGGESGSAQSESGKSLTGNEAQAESAETTEAAETAETAEATEAAEAAETAEATEVSKDADVPANPAFLQIQLLRPDLTWTDPVRDDSVLSPGEDGFLSMCIYANNMPGDVLYRTFSGSRGWSNWAMNGGHSEWAADSPVEAIQIRLNGVFGNAFDVYYSSTLSNGTECDWAKNGATSGAMASDKHITAIRLSMWGKAVEGASYKMDSPLDAPAPDGIKFTDGIPTYSSGTGQPFTGWAWNDRDRYYFVDNAAVTGWQYIDGYKYYFREDGRLVTDLEPYLNHPGPFMLRINKQMNCTTVYIQDGSNGFIIPYKAFLCSTGDDTPLGTFKTPEKYRWRLMNTGESCQYCTRLGAGLPILLHSVIYESPNSYTLKPNTYNYLGATPSHGCIRYTTRDCKWIFDNCALGTSIQVYESPVPGPFDRPAIENLIPTTQTWDPTDVNVPENGLQG